MFLYLEDLVPNALIELVENNVSKTISYKSVLEYGCQVIEELRLKNIEALLVVNRDKTAEFEKEYKEIFDFFEINNNVYIGLKKNINTNYLRKYFRTMQSLDTLEAMTSEKAKQTLGIKKKTLSKHP